MRKMAPEVDLAQQLRAERERGARKQRLLEGENEILKLIVERAPLPAILAQLVRAAEQQGSAALLASILLMDDDGVHLRHGAAPSLPDAYNRAIDGLEIGPSVGSCGAAAYRREAVVVCDIAADPLWGNFRELALQHGLRACWSTPVMSSRGQVLGTFALYYREPSNPNLEDLSIVQMLTRTCALAIEHKRAEQRLADSEERFRSLSRCLPLGIFTTDTLGAFTYVNPKFHELSGYSHEKTVVYWLQNSMRPDLREQVAGDWTVRAQRLEQFELDLPLADSRVVRLRAAPMTSAGGLPIGYVGTVEDVSST
jgi:PAS domain S-box-containing protein